MAKIILTDQDLTILKRALNEVLNGSKAIDDPEFSNRIGFERNQAIRLSEQLKQKMDTAVPEKPMKGSEQDRTNQELLKILSHLIYEYPSMRFSQILLTYGFVQVEPPASPLWKNDYPLASTELLKRIGEKG